MTTALDPATLRAVAEEMSTDADKLATQCRHSDHCYQCGWQIGFLNGRADQLRQQAIDIDIQRGTVKQ